LNMAWACFAWAWSLHFLGTWSFSHVIRTFYAHAHAHAHAHASPPPFKFNSSPALFFSLHQHRQSGINSSPERTSHQSLQRTSHFPNHVSSLYVYLYCLFPSEMLWRHHCLLLSGTMVNNHLVKRSKIILLITFLQTSHPSSHQPLRSVVPFRTLHLLQFLVPCCQFMPFSCLKASWQSPAEIHTTALKQLTRRRNSSSRRRLLRPLQHVSVSPPLVILSMFHCANKHCRGNQLGR
jgi:hypothetical protein